MPISHYEIFPFFEQQQQKCSVASVTRRRRSKSPVAVALARNAIQSQCHCRPVRPHLVHRVQTLKHYQRSIGAKFSSERWVRVACKHCNAPTAIIIQTIRMRPNWICTRAVCWIWTTVVIIMASIYQIFPVQNRGYVNTFITISIVREIKRFTIMNDIRSKVCQIFNIIRDNEENYRIKTPLIRFVSNFIGVEDVCFIYLW